MLTVMINNNLLKYRHNYISRPKGYSSKFSTTS